MDSGGCSGGGSAIFNKIFYLVLGLRPWDTGGTAGDPWDVRVWEYGNLKVPEYLLFYIQTFGNHKVPEYFCFFIHIYMYIT